MNWYFNLFSYRSFVLFALKTFFISITLLSCIPSSLLGQVEICDNFQDDDGDGDIDEADSDCYIQSIGGLCEGSKGDNIFPEGNFGTVQPGDEVPPQNDSITIKRLPDGITTYDYQLSGGGGRYPNDGSYVLSNATAGMNPGNWRIDQTGQEIPKWISIEDNSADPNGYMMVVNAGYDRGSFYQAEVSGLCGGRIYEFSADIINIYSPHFAPFGNETGENHILPNIDFILAPPGIDQWRLTQWPATHSTGDIMNDGAWNTYGFSFIAPPDGETIHLVLRNNAPGGIGNDLALDNISFRLCGEPAEIDFAGTVQNNCTGVPSSMQATSFGGYSTPFYQWQISNDNGITWSDIPGANTDTYEPATIGPNDQFRLLLADTEANLTEITCRLTSNILSFNNQALEFGEVSPDTTVCEGETVQLQASGGVLYTWTPAPTLSDATIADPIASPTTETTYIVNIEDANGCVDEDTVVVTVVNKAIIDAGEDTTICRGEAIILQGTGTGASWVADPGLSDITINNPIATPLDTTEYIFQAGIGSCLVADSVTVSVLPVPVMVVNPDTTVCIGEEIQLQASGADNFFWTDFAGVESYDGPDPTIFVNESKQFEVIGYGDAGCETRDTVNITSVDRAFEDVPYINEACVGQEIRMYTSGDFLYEWSTGETGDSLNIIPSDTLTRRYWLIPYTAGGCVGDTVPFTVRGITSPIVDMFTDNGDSSVCAGESLQLFADGGTIYRWVKGSNISDPFISDPFISPVADEYYVVEVENNIGCASVDSILISVTAPPEITVSSDTSICEGTETQLIATGALSYFWTSASDSDTFSIPRPVVLVDEDKLYRVFARDQSGCLAVDSVNVQMIPKPTEELDSLYEACIGEEIDIETSGAYTYLWSNRQRGIALSLTPEDTITEDYWVFPIDSNKCRGDTIPFSVKGILKPIASFSPVDNIEGFGPLPVQFMNESQHADLYSWDFGNAGSSTEADPLHEFLLPGEYRVILTAENLFGCSDTASFSFIEVWPPEIFFPNAFSPNGDGFNDHFKLPSAGFDQLNWAIYDRWGKQLIASFDPEFRWDGKVEGISVPEGVYVCQIEAITETGIVIQKTFSITLIR